ncbi:MAG: GAF domain-containing protein [Planctomycetes bacterium]|nr:GAF domain-containing protein [Planctomycetota bacterium]
MRNAERELQLLHFQRELESQLARVRGTDKAHKIGLRLVREFLRADEAFVVVPLRGGRGIEARFRAPADACFDATAMHELLRRGAPRRPEMIVQPLHRRGRRWGSLVLRRADASFDRDERKEAARIARTMSHALQRLDELRLLEVRTRIDRKITEQIRPQDLFYQILHGLRSLLRYDHSAAVLIQDETPGAAELVAEQIAWTKAKSARIGFAIPLGASAQAALDAGELLGFDRDASGRWVRWDGGHDTSLADALDAGSLAHEMPARSLLVAPLVGPEGVLGVLRVACIHPHTLTAYEADLLRGFLPQATMAIRQMQRAAHLERGLLEAEKKHAMASLARGVSHDVNNALGAVLPLVQQMLAELDEGRPVAPDLLRRDLLAVQSAVTVCRRIFGGMLGLARGSATSLGEGHLGRAVTGTLAVLAETMRRHRIEVVVDVPADLPPVRCGQGDLEQIVLNLATNARDAMQSGGRLLVRARAHDDLVELSIGDTGAGIPEDQIARVQEPFFSTKQKGTGLGLSICRSLAWDMGGTLDITSRPGEGTTVRVTMPAAVRGEMALSRA